MRQPRRLGPPPEFVFPQRHKLIEDEWAAKILTSPEWKAREERTEQKVLALKVIRLLAHERAQLVAEWWRWTVFVAAAIESRDVEAL
jgi:hypothetical protein